MHLNLKCYGIIEESPLCVSRDLWGKKVPVRLLPGLQEQGQLNDYILNFYMGRKSAETKLWASAVGKLLEGSV